MFDPEQLTQEVIQQMTTHFAHLVNTLLQDKNKLSLLTTDNWREVFDRYSSLVQDIRLLTRIANGDIPGDLADDDLMSDVSQAIESVCRALFTSPRQYSVPSAFWNTELGTVIQHCQLWLRGDDLISYTEAAELLWPEEDIQAARMRIKRMVERGELTPYTDPRENNPQRAARVSREEVLSLRL
ncbi:MAG: hypothetical protein KJ064_15880 [Anaerolineae bacterium]|nr:hypothetical protein [Anaerolineae bacterium]